MITAELWGLFNCPHGARTRTHVRAHTHTHTHTLLGREAEKLEISQGQTLLRFGQGRRDVMYDICDICGFEQNLGVTHTQTHTCARTHTRTHSQTVMALHSPDSPPSLILTQWHPKRRQASGCCHARRAGPGEPQSSLIRCAIHPRLRSSHIHTAFLPNAVPRLGHSRGPYTHRHIHRQQSADASQCRAKRCTVPVVLPAVSQRLPTWRAVLGEKENDDRTCPGQLSGWCW